MIYAVFAPQQALISMFGEALSEPLALALVIISISKVAFISLILF